MSLLSKTKDLFRRSEKKETPAKKTRVAAAGKSRKAVEATPASEPKGKAVVLGETAARIGLTPLMTEKGMAMTAQVGAAAFRVRPSATKMEIARAIQEQYSVKPLSIRTVTMRGKRRVRGKTVGNTAQWKKAYVKVEDVQKLHVTP